MYDKRSITKILRFCLFLSKIQEKEIITGLIYFDEVFTPSYSVSYIILIIISTIYVKGPASNNICCQHQIKNK